MPVQKHPTLSVNEELRDLVETIKIQPILIQQYQLDGDPAHCEKKILEQRRIIAGAQKEVYNLERAFLVSPEKAKAAKQRLKALNIRHTLLKNKRAVDKIERLYRALQGLQE